MYDIIVKLFANVYYSFFSALFDASKTLNEDLEKMYPLVGAFVTKGQEAIKGAALAIISVCFLMDIMQNVLLKADELRMEDIIKALIKLVIAKEIIDFTPALLDAITASVGDMVKAISKATEENMLTEDGLYGIFEKIIPSDEIPIVKVPVSAILYLIIHMLDYILMFIAKLIISVICYARRFELIVLRVISPLPMSFLPWSETKDVPKKFLMNYFAVALQAVIIMICSSVMATIMVAKVSKDSFDVDFILIYVIVYILSIFKSGQWAKQVLGVA